MSRRRPGSGVGALLATAAIAGLAAGAARGTWTALRSRPPGGAALWDRRNHRGDQISLLEGPAYTLATATMVGLTPGLPPRVRAAAVLATLAGGAFGAIDDLRESGKSKGLRGHLGELAHGRVTTGGLKVLGIGSTGLLAAALIRPGSRTGSRTNSKTGRPADVLIDGAVIAGTANLLNLFDLRPGRALKVVLLTTPAVAGAGPAGRLVAVAAGAAAGLLPVDLAEQAMLGDTGANAAGALLGTAAVAGLGRRSRLGLLLGLAGLTLASERVSFTKVIERTRCLREFDAWGRRPRGE